MKPLLILVSLLLYTQTYIIDQFEGFDKNQHTFIFYHNPFNPYSILMRKLWQENQNIRTDTHIAYLQVYCSPTNCTNIDTFPTVKFYFQKYIIKTFRGVRDFDLFEGVVQRFKDQLVPMDSLSQANNIKIVLINAPMDFYKGQSFQFTGIDMMELPPNENIYLNFDKKGSNEITMEANTFYKINSDICIIANPSIKCKKHAARYKIPQNDGILIYRPLERVMLFQADTKPTSLTRTEAYTQPAFGYFDKVYGRALFEYNIRTVLLFCNSSQREFERMLKKVSQELYPHFYVLQYAIVVYKEGNEVSNSLYKFFSVTTLPSIFSIELQPSNKEETAHKYQHDEITEENIKDFILNFESQPVYYRSQPIQRQLNGMPYVFTNGLAELTSDGIRELLSEKKEFLILMTTIDCDQCSNAELEIRRYKNKYPGIAVGVVNAYYNNLSWLVKVNQYPTMVFLHSNGVPVILVGTLTADEMHKRISNMKEDL